MSVSVNKIVDVTVELTNPISIVSDFSTGLIIGNTADRIPAATRIKEYARASWQQEMTTDKFTTTDPEYLAVQAYFAQSPTPDKVCVASRVTDTDVSDVVVITDCRSKNNDWFGVCFCYDIDDSISDIGAAVEAFDQKAVFFYQTKDANCLTLDQDNILKTMMKANYDFSVGFYSTQDNFIAGVLGRFSGLNRDTAGTAYTFAYKDIAGFKAEDLSDSQLTALKSYNGNAYMVFSKRYDLIYPAISASGLHVDELYFIELAKFLIQENTVAGIISRLKVPQTESGLNDIISYITTACERLNSIGWIGDGIWLGETVLDLTAGMAVPSGYMIQSESLSSQSATDRQNRVTPPIYVSLKGTGAFEHVTIRVYIDR